MLRSRFHRLSFHAGIRARLVYILAKTDFHPTQLAVRSRMVPALYPYGNISLLDLAQGHKDISGQRRADYFYHPAYAQHSVVLCLLRAQISVVGAAGYRAVVDRHPFNHNKFLPRLQNRLIAADPLYSMGQLRHSPKFLNLSAQSINQKRQQNNGIKRLST